MGWRRKNDSNKYHLYFVNIFVSKDTLTKIINGINTPYGKTLLDESCITKFVRFEGFRKLNKQKKYITGSEYEIVKYFKDNPTKYDMDLTNNLYIEDFYEAMYCCNERETPIPDINIVNAHTKSTNNIATDNIDTSSKCKTESIQNDIILYGFSLTFTTCINVISSNIIR